MPKNWYKCPCCQLKIMAPNYHEITKDDLKPFVVIEIQGKKFPTYSIMGGLRSFDVGKRLVLVNGLLYMENDKQYQERIKS